MSSAAELSQNHVYRALISANNKIPSMRGQTLDVTEDFARAVAGDSFEEIVGYFHEIDHRIRYAGNYEPGKEYALGIDHTVLEDLALPHSHFSDFGMILEFIVVLKYESESKFEVMRAVVLDTKKYP